MNKKKTSKKAKTVLKDKAVSLNNDAFDCPAESNDSAFQKLAIEALSERIEFLEENLERLTGIVEQMLGDDCGGEDELAEDCPETSTTFKPSLNYTTYLLKLKP